MFRSDDERRPSLVFALFLFAFNVGLRAGFWAVVGSGWALIIGWTIAIIQNWGAPSLYMTSQAGEWSYVTVPYGAIAGAPIGVIHSVWVVIRQTRKEIARQRNALMP